VVRANKNGARPSSGLSAVADRGGVDGGAALADLRSSVRATDVIATAVGVSVVQTASFKPWRFASSARGHAASIGTDEPAAASSGSDGDRQPAEPYLPARGQVGDIPPGCPS
jgi:hypothetical protein